MIQAILHYDDTIKLQYLKVWRLRTRQELHQHSVEVSSLIVQLLAIVICLFIEIVQMYLKVKAQDHYEQYLLIKAITGWKNFAREMTIRWVIVGCDV